MKQFGHPPSVNPERFHLIAPYESDPRRWLKMDWIVQDTGKHYPITTASDYHTPQTAWVKTYGDVLEEYEFHPEPKYAGADGNPSDKQTIGLLQRRPIRVEEIKSIGKESNLLEEVESGLIDPAQNVYTEYPHPREWETKILPALKKMPLPLLRKLSRMSRRALMDLRAGRSRPRRKNQELLEAIVRKLGLI